MAKNVLALSAGLLLLLPLGGLLALGFSKLPHKSSFPESGKNYVSPHFNLDKVYSDAVYGFSFRFPSSFLEKELPSWRVIVDDDTKANLWLGLCSPACAHLVRSPFGNTVADYTSDYSLTTDDSPDVPVGEARRVDIIYSLRFTTSGGVIALEQQYKVTGSELSTGKASTLYCAEDTLCSSTDISLRYVFFSPGKDPYAILLRASGPLDEETLKIGRMIANTVLY